MRSPKLKIKKELKILIFGLIIGVVGISGAISYKIYADSKKKTTNQSSETNMDVGKTILSSDEKKTLEDIKSVYNESNQEKIKETLEKQKKSEDYTQDNMLIKYNPYGTNTQSLYIYFKTEDAVSVSYKVHVSDDSIQDFSQSVYQKNKYQKTHEFQLIGLVPNKENKITITMKTKDGSTIQRTFTYKMGDLLGSEETKLEVTDGTSKQKLSNGLYVVMGNDSDGLDFMYYYDNHGILRGEVPIIGYRIHRLLFDENAMYYSISQTKIAKVNRLGRVVKVYDTGIYNLHHDYVFDDEGNILTLATDTTKKTVEDVVIRINKRTGQISNVLDLENLLDDYKTSLGKEDEEGLDWAHINTIQWLGDDEILLSSRETSTIIKVKKLYDDPEIDYMIGDDTFWDSTGYESLLLEKKGDFTIQGGQHSITYVKDSGLKEGQYYLYMYNNNIGISESRSDFDWSAIGLTNSGAAKGDASYYYQYLVDEKEGTFELVDSFKVPYSGYVSSAQNIGNNTVMDSGLAGTFGEYDKNHKLIASYNMKIEKFIYRVYKYNFKGFYFS